MDEDLKSWITGVFERAARDFVDRSFGGDPRLVDIQPWEVEKLKGGVEKSLLSLTGSFLKLPPASGDKDSISKKYSLFTLNREYLTHLAMYAELITDGGFSEKDVHFEYNQFDLMVMKVGNPYIGIEVRKSEREGNILLEGMGKILPEVDLSLQDMGNDPLRKLKYLLESKPQEFWIVTPTKRWKFSPRYLSDTALELAPLMDSV